MFGKKSERFDTKLAGMIDHTLLKADATPEALIKLCEEAKQYHFASVCVNSGNVALVAQELKDSDVKPIAVVGFPLGAMLTAAKVVEIQQAIALGAEEIDMVINLGALKAQDYRTVYTDILKVVEAAAACPVKVIIETALLTYEEKISACVLAKAAGAAFVKTSTGFSDGGATVEDIKLMRKIVGKTMKIKASGAIRTREQALALVAAGADRIGASASVDLVKNVEGK